MAGKADTHVVQGSLTAEQGVWEVQNQEGQMRTLGWMNTQCRRKTGNWQGCGSLLGRTSGGKLEGSSLGGVFQLHMRVLNVF